MINFSYNLSLVLKNYLSKVESLRQKILLTPISPKTELRIRWEAMMNRIYWSMIVNGKQLSKSRIVKILSQQAKEKVDKEEREITKYKNALDYIRQNWLVSDETVSPKTVLMLQELSGYGKFRSSLGTLKQLLDYLQRAPENAIIQASIAYIQILNIAPFTKENTKAAYLLAYLFLYKGGYDFRGLLVLEECWHPDLIIYRSNLTPILEEFSKVLANQLEKTADLNLESQAELVGLSASFWELNDRQKAILNYLEQPNLTITNKKVQNLFNISQITASRDLAKLANLGLLFTHGKGRSVFYTRV
jgi:Fic family protein